MEILYRDEAILVCLKPAGALSTDEPGGVPSLAREALGDPGAEIRTVHRLDRVVSGLMLLARTAESASALSRQIREGVFQKEYLAVVHGDPGAAGTLRDLMYRDKARKMSFVTDAPGRGVQEAVLDFRCLGREGELSLLRVRLHTGRTHQIRCQFASRGYPLAGERKYCEPRDACPLALFSARLAFSHPVSGKWTEFSQMPPNCEPWSKFSNYL